LRGRQNIILEKKMKTIFALAVTVLGAVGAQQAGATTLVVDDYMTGVEFTRQCEILDFVLDSASPKESNLVADCTNAGFNAALLGPMPKQPMPQLGNFEVTVLFKPKTNCYVEKYDATLEYIKVVCKKTFAQRP
jgi:hypothetical protein